MAIGIVKNASTSNGSSSISRWTEFVENQEVEVGGTGISIGSLPAAFEELYIKISSTEDTTTYSSYLIIPKILLSSTTQYMYASGGNHGETSPNGCIIKYSLTSLGVHLYYRSGDDIQTAYMSIYYR